MLEGLVAWVLNNYLGKYVENLNTDQLSIALLSGEVELENLPLKREALRHIGLPIEIKVGFIGKVRLQIPVRQIRSASWVIAIEQLYLVAGPINLEGYDSEVEEQILQEYKHSKLDSLEARWRASTERDPGYYASSYSSWLNYGTSLVTNIIENLQLNIKDVHLRFEDDVTPGLSQKSGVALGVTIKALSAQSCDASWIPGSTSWNFNDASFKLMELDGLSIYWNHLDSSQLFGKLNLGDLAVAMNESKSTMWKYILSPVSACARIKRDRSEKPLRSITRPRIVVDLQLDQVPLLITDEQYEQIVKCIKELEDIERRRRQRRCRPHLPISEAPKEWWKYAVRCHLGREALKPKPTWRDIYNRGVDNVFYVETYQKILATPTAILSPDAKSRKERIEYELSYDELRVLRELAMAKVRPPAPAKAPEADANSPAARGMLVQWFPQWWGWYSKAPQSNSTPSQPGSSAFDGELLDVLADTIDDNTLLRRDTVFGQFNFTLSKGAISLCTKDKDNTGDKVVMELQFERVVLSYESRPRSGSHKFSISLGALYLHDFLTVNSIFPILIQPQTLPVCNSRLRSSSEKLVAHQNSQQPLFELIYEKKPFHVTTDHSLSLSTRSLDVVYNSVAIRWLVDFVSRPHKNSSNPRLQAMKRRTRRQLMKNWEQILEGDFVYRSSWDLQFNISAPQILLVENFQETTAAVVVVDFGRLHLTNSIDNKKVVLRPGSPTSEDDINDLSQAKDIKDLERDEDDEDERFQTPCSTPPGSQENGSIQEFQGISESAIHHKLYDQYSIYLSDLQVLVGKVKDNWKHARTRGMSTLHVLERFNISLQIERRVVSTVDPQFPSLTISGNLPRLVVHVNEQKVEAIRSMSNQLITSLSGGSEGHSSQLSDPGEPESPKKEEPLDKTMNHAMMIQFMIDQMTFELQSRGRSVAELQVSGVRAAMTKRPADLSVSLSVHGLLLVDAMQEFGPDFELLVASHKHVGMDSVSGSLKDSEPTSPVSPVSPGSPDPTAPRRLTSPVALTRALSNLAHDTKNLFSPRNNSLMGLEQLDNEALIVVELTLIEDPLEKLRVASIQFNNLDIIANQETIVELIGFVRRLLPSSKVSKNKKINRQDSILSLTVEGKPERTEITFDFHRLNVLLLRAVMQDSHLIGQKIATATMSDARIQATLATNTSISGSLGGLQVLDQTLIGKTHQRIISVGRDPLCNPSHDPLEHVSGLSNQPEAFSFSASRNSTAEGSGQLDSVDIAVRVGSVWYTHAPHLISELRSCADEFKQYLSNLARHIGAAATDMAMGLVHEDWSGPQRKRLPSFSQDIEATSGILTLRLDVVLDSPVLVIPRSSHSPQVFVAHLGTMSLQHEPSDDSKLTVSLDVRDINLYSLDVSSKLSHITGTNLPLRADDVYSCKESGRPILHDTSLKILVEKGFIASLHSSGFLLDQDFQTSSQQPIVQVHGGVITPLKVSLSRSQYEQLLDTVHVIFSAPQSTSANIPPAESTSTSKSYSQKSFQVAMKVLFELPTLSIQLKQDHSEQPLVELSMQEFVTKYEKLSMNDSTTQVSLRSLLMEDLLCPIGSRHRSMMQSSAPTRAKVPLGVSRSCPDLAFNKKWRSEHGRGSLPDRLETDTLYGTIPAHWRKASSLVGTPNTPPPSPGAITCEENLVLISITMTEILPKTDSLRPILQKSVCIDFNCLDLVVSVESWMIVLDFFGIGTSQVNSRISTRTRDLATSTTSIATASTSTAANGPANEYTDPSGVTKELHSDTEIEIRSLTLVLTRTDKEIAKANISNASMTIVKASGKSKVSGSLGSMSLLDLTPHGRFYRERFLSSGRKALNFQYSSYEDSRRLSYDAKLKLQMSSVHYVHTQRFVAELQAFFRHFSQLRAVMQNLRSGEVPVLSMEQTRGTRLSLELHAGAPVILLPVSSQSDKLAVLDLGELTAHNSFHHSKDSPQCLLDVMHLELVNMDVFAAQRIRQCLDRSDYDNSGDDSDTLMIGGFYLKKLGPSLLTEKCHLSLRIERNLDTYINRDIPDLSVHGTLSTMNCALDPAQYMLIRGLLAHNIGENLDDILLFLEDLQDSTEYFMTEEAVGGKVWTKSCVILDIVNVAVKLHPNHGIAALACVNFIKSRLTLDSLSDGSQDIDLVSQEILVIDTRFQDEPVNKRSNVFTSILQPLKNFGGIEDRVQAEIHHRRRKNNAATTILLHSMRLTAILDWWEAVRDFLILNSPEPEPIGISRPPLVSQEIDPSTTTSSPFELKLNLTDSELVIVEDTSLWDTNAVILKCTAVLAYRSHPQDGEKPLSCNLSHCELYSCILGMEEETALSIIDPVGASVELTKEKALEIQLQPLNVKLSYHDVTMFGRMVNSLPKQTLWAKQRSLSGPPANAKSHIMKLSALGFAETDCEAALDVCNGQLDDAALWLTQHAVPNAEDNRPRSGFQAIEIETACLRICVIDDCRDADVPLAELVLMDFCLRQVLEGPGSMRATFGVDYYNRVLSGWEPFIEPWKTSARWEHSVGNALNTKRLQVEVQSEDSVNVNITSTLVELVSLVKDNWTQDYYLSNKHDPGASKSSSSSLNSLQGYYRRRSPFVPFALKNETGTNLWFKTFIAVADDVCQISEYFNDDNNLIRDKTWREVPSGETIPFTFEERGKLRHQTTHQVRRHQIAVLVEGWRPVDPVTVDRIGVYFRHASADLKLVGSSAGKARVVFAVELEGSARKLVTVRSALQIANKLSHPVDIKLEKLGFSQFGYYGGPVNVVNSSTKVLHIPEHSVMSVPLTHTSVKMYLKPQHPNFAFQYSMEPIEWTLVKKPMEVVEVLTTCRTNQNNLFRMCVAVRRDNYPVDTGQNILPAHTISLLPPVTLTNLLPHEVSYQVSTAETGRIGPGMSADLHSVNVEEQLEITVQLDGYPGSGTLLLSQISGSFVGRMKLTDSAGRILFLNAAVIVERGSAVKINITAPYWIVNKTGLPLVFRQEGVGTEAAGQFEEHERARMVAPLLFSFSDEEASRTLAVRVGSGVHPNGVSQWSQHFHLQPGVQVHRLRISLRDGRPDIVYLIGVSTRTARGRYRATTVVTLSPRYQLHNRSSCTLELAQRCFTTTVSHPDAQATYITAMPDCHMPFHWPRLDKDQLLCVRIIDVPNCMWSGGIILDGNHSLTINIRDAGGKMHFLRVDVVLQESTYFIVFTDANTMPPPIRVDNFSEVALTINQAGVLDSLQWTVRPHSSVPYALDEPTQSANLTVTAPGGVTGSYDLNLLGENRGLTYENFIYIAFTGTFKIDGDLGTGEGGLDPLDVETQRLVLEAGPGGWVALRRKQNGARSQLWRMTGDGQLQHEGSSPPRDKHSRTPDSVLVLDIAGTAPQPFTYCALALRRPDQRRRSTQTWRFTDDGRLCCAHKNMCVQSKDGFMGLYEGGSVARWQMWSEAVLGPQTHSDPPPIEQRVGRQRLRPGSGFLSVRVTTDGPTRVIQVLDIKERKKTFALLEERDWSHIAVAQRPSQLNPSTKKPSTLSSELQVAISLPAGLGLSVVSRRPVEELLFARLVGIAFETIQTPSNTTLNLSIDDVQIDNQLFEAQCTSVLYITRPSRAESDERPAIDVATEKLPSKNQNAEIFKHLIVSIKPLCVHLEERLILKLAAFVGTGSSDFDVPVDENDFKAQRLISQVSAAHARRYYFGVLKLVPSQVKLSVLTTTKLPRHLQSIKRKLGLTLIKFEDASIELEPFVKKHPFESSQFLIHSILKHYKDELKWQAAVILGSVDFLGNPLGFVNDVSEGVSGLIHDKSVTTLVKNVTHGLSNSAAKLTESLSDGLGRVILDESHEETRQRIRTNTAGSSDHLVAGLKGLGFGLLGGFTSIFKQTYDGAANEGFPGFFAGLGKGVVGTVTKPVVGVLDLASEAATAIRESSRSAHRAIPKRDRLPRVASGPAGLLPPYNCHHAEGQEFLYSINQRDYSELYVAYESLCSGTENLSILVSNERVRVISGSTKTVVTEVSLADLVQCQPTQVNESNGSTLYYIELTSRIDSAGGVTFDGPEVLRRPKVRCDTEEIAKWVSQQINYAKGMHQERRLTLMSSDNMLDDIHSYK
ncbi:vacuolar protein sorting-associated protein 13D isoform X1 [Diachasma alloeum]|uniref:vacuolar protein sorting-associated protein 13D isoform X1 n=1 Tax=Diachasma alloeum TaxID=454923 RepID=UPI0007383093|nr:vacuolar protein sorting-associated protein 13D isoform X1 [Diachasma alloeum]